MQLQLANQFTENLGNDIGLDMVLIPGGSFLMGAPESERESTSDERPQHHVAVPAFYMGKYTVTQAQWRAVAALPKVNRDIDPKPSNFKGDNLPVESIGWYDAVEFCDRLSLHTGKKYRLPSEAEWEYACRAGTTTPSHFGETVTPDLANCFVCIEKYSVSIMEPTPVGQYPPNAFGLYDMHGNVWEWCYDHWHNNYEGAPSDGSAWLSNVEYMRVMRGGSFHDNPKKSRSAYRGRSIPGIEVNYLGMRVVCDK